MLKEGDSYQNWKKRIQLWRHCTTIPKEGQAPAVALTLEGAAGVAAIKLDLDDIATETGMDHLISELDKLFISNTDQAIYHSYHAFEQFRRSPEMSIAEFIINFELLYDRAKSHGNILTQPVLAYRLLKGAGLNEEREQLIRATCDKWEYDVVKAQLRKVYDEQSTNYNLADTSSPSISEPISIKSEPDTIMEASASDQHDEWYLPASDLQHEVLYAKRGRAFYPYNSNKSREPKMNPVVNGVRLKCIACKSIFHLIKDCEHRYERQHEQETRHSENRNYKERKPKSMNRRTYVAEGEDDDPEEIYIALFASHLGTDVETKIVNSYMNTFVGECLGKGILDCGCPHRVAGNGWSVAYIESLTDDQRKKVKVTPTQTKYRFGSGKIYQAIKKITVPAHLGNQLVLLSYDVIDADLPLLLGKDTMKKAETEIYLHTDSVTMLGSKQPLCYTSSGHYAVHLNPKTKAIESGKPVKVLLSTDNISEQSENEKEKIAKKLHQQFAHPRSEKLKKLLKHSGVNDEILNSKIEELDSKCNTCRIYKKPASRPVVCTSLAQCFNQVISMDLFFFKKSIVLHLCDTATRYSRAVEISSKSTGAVIAAVFQMWIGIFGSPEKILTDGGGEFSSDEFRTMGEALNTVIMSTSTESAWQNGINERHNGILKHMLERILQDNKVSLQVALAWACSAKNALANVYGFAPNQLVFGRNTNHPNVLDDKLPALDLEPNSSSEIILKNLKCQATAREAFIQAESSQKIKRALKSKVRTSTSLIYQNGEAVYYWREGDRRWRGPGRIIGKDNKNILVRHQGSIVSVNPCRITHVHPEEISPEITLTNSNTSEVRERRQGISTTQHDSCSSEDEYITHVPKKADSTDEQENSYDGILNIDMSDSDSTSDSDSPTDKGPEDNEEAHGEPPVETENNEAHEEPDPETENNLEERIPIHEQNIKVKEKKTKSVRDTLPQPGTEIRYKPTEEDTWHDAKVISYGGKTKGANKHCINLHDTTEGTNKCVDFKKKVTAWELKETAEHIMYGSKIDHPKVTEAKQQELAKWVENNVYTEVENQNQKCVTTRWVYTEKGDKIKARLVARGFEETHNSDFRKDSPTCTKPAFRLALSILNSNGWKIHCLDVAAAFLQGQPIDREVFLKPPPEAMKANTLWKLQRCVYGLDDAGRHWYLRILEEIKKLNGKKSVYDEAVYMWHQNEELEGLMISHVDDFLHGGSDQFTDRVIKGMKETFNISKEGDLHFKYLGLNVQQEDKSIEIDQNAYIESVQPIKIKGKQENKPNEEELLEFRSLIGQMQWLSTQTRPDISFEACQASVSFKDVTYKDIQKANKAIRKVKNDEVKIKYPQIGKLAESKFICFSDASLGNLPEGKSQIGYIIFLANEQNEVNPICWKSVKAKRVVRSTIAAECLALSEGAGVCYYLRTLLAEILNVKSEVISIQCYTDNKNLHQCIHSTHTLPDTRQLVDVAEIRNKLELKEITEVKWIRTEDMLADVFTKAGASGANLLKTLEEGRLQLEE